MLLKSIHKTLSELSDLLDQLSNEEYAAPCRELSNSSIGAHTRHVIELFQCMDTQYESGCINYDNRLRDYHIQSDVFVAKEALKNIVTSIARPNKKVILQQVIDGEPMNIESNYTRELLYNLEHCIHHQALIKVAILQMNHLQIDEDFGVARSTIEYRKQCAQ